jgi:hypothetical protein
MKQITPAMLAGEDTPQGQHFYRELADALHPEGCKCHDRSGSCSWCYIYYDGLDDEEIAIVEEEIREEAARNSQFGVGA